MYVCYCGVGILICSLQKGFRAVLNYDPSLCVLAYCLSGDKSIRVKVLILKVSGVETICITVVSGQHEGCMCVSFCLQSPIANNFFMGILDRLG